MRELIREITFTSAAISLCNRENRGFMEKPAVAVNANMMPNNLANSFQLVIGFTTTMPISICFVISCHMMPANMNTTETMVAMVGLEMTEPIMPKFMTMNQGVKNLIT